MTRKLFWTTSAGLLLLALAGCAGIPDRAPLSRDPGPAPAYLKRVDPPEPKAGDYALEPGAAAALALGRANCIIAAGAAEWNRTRAEMIAGRPVDRADQAPVCPPEPKQKPGTK